MDFHEALTESARTAGLSPTQIGALIGRGEQSVRQYMSGSAVPAGDVMLSLMRLVPGLAERLGFKALAHAA